MGAGGGVFGNLRDESYSFYAAAGTSRSSEEIDLGPTHCLRKGEQRVYMHTSS